VTVLENILCFAHVVDYTSSTATAVTRPTPKTSATTATRPESSTTANSTKTPESTGGEISSSESGFLHYFCKILRRFYFTLCISLHNFLLKPSFDLRVLTWRRRMLHIHDYTRHDHI